MNLRSCSSAQPCDTREPPFAFASARAHLYMLQALPQTNPVNPTCCRPPPRRAALASRTLAWRVPIFVSCCTRVSTYIHLSPHMCLLPATHHDVFITPLNIRSTLASAPRGTHMRSRETRLRKGGGGTPPRGEDAARESIGPSTNRGTRRAHEYMPPTALAR